MKVIHREVHPALRVDGRRHAVPPGYREYTISPAYGYSERYIRAEWIPGNYGTEYMLTAWERKRDESFPRPLPWSEKSPHSVGGGKSMATVVVTAAEWFGSHA